MPFFDIYSKRQKKLRGDVPDVYTYDNMSKELKIQIIHIWRDALGNNDQYQIDMVYQAYECIVNILCREYGQFKLIESNEYANRNYINELQIFFLDEQNIERALDVVELSFMVIDTATRKVEYLHRYNSVEIAEAAIKELNERFKEHGTGYQFCNGKIIRIDSELIHSEVVKPALRLLNQTQYVGAQQEFLKAHEHYRHGNAKETLNECLKAFESLMKAICDKRGWTYNSNATAQDLIQACLDNDLIPAFWKSNFTSLRSLLGSSIPTARNKLGGHGQGTIPTVVPEHLVAYMLHMTASAIVFLAEAEAALP